MGSDFRTRTFGLGLSNSDSDFRTRTFGLGLSDLDFRTWTFGLGLPDLDLRTWTFRLGLSDLDFRTWTFRLSDLVSIMVSQILTKNSFKSGNGLVISPLLRDFCRLYRHTGSLHKIKVDIFHK